MLIGDDVRGVAGSAVTGKLYVGYRDTWGNGMLYCLEPLEQESPARRRSVGEQSGRAVIVRSDLGRRTADHIQVLDAQSGDLVRRVYFSSRSHDTQYPLAGPVFQTTKADDGSGNYLYMVKPQTYAVSRVGPYLGI